jgi:hypothetical protein
MFHYQEKKFSGDTRKHRSSGRSRIGWSCVAVGLGGVVFLVQMFFSGKVVVLGVPSSVIVKFLDDKQAVDAYWNGRGAKVHERLQAMNIEKDMKDFYRHKIHDEIELDRYIHQLLYDRTGYVGVDYQLQPEGRLTLKSGITKPSMSHK